MKYLHLCVSFMAFMAFSNTAAQQTQQLKITVENNITGAPVTLGIPFPKDELASVDHMRLLDAKGREIPCQTTEVTTWGPEHTSVKWAWVFFFSEKEKEYTLEYGEKVSAMVPEQAIVSSNNMRPSGGIQVNTGPLSFYIHKKGDGFLDEVFLDDDANGLFEEDELLASAPEKHRGSFLDILDDNGIDPSKAIINEVFREKGSGRLHQIFRIEGTYVYEREDNNISPFVMYVHAYAGKQYVKVLHTLTYTGEPDKHKKQKGEHANIATQNKEILSENTEDDIGWTQPNDQIAACGLQLKYHLGADAQVNLPLQEGNWNDQDGELITNSYQIKENESLYLLQKGPDWKKSTSLRSLYRGGFKRADMTETEEESQFSAHISKGKETLTKAERAPGWMHISDGGKGIAIGINNFLKEYPKGLAIDAPSQTLMGHIWPEANGPMSFARHNTEPDGGMLGNFAQGVTKTTEFIYYFHNSAEAEEDVANIMGYVINAPVAHADPTWYTNTKVYGHMATASKDFSEFENALQYHYQWWSYNQNHEPWYGMFDYGDGKSYFFNDRWVQWTNNEPTVDFMLWTNFMRTGDPKYFNIAQAMSRHTMDVDNVHWPKKRTYYGEINDAIDFWDYEDEPESTPYLGIGRRHANEHWYALLSAHVWIQGWIADYYLAADHRALAVAKMTGDTYINRIWGDHDLRGRRLYLSVLNLVELYEATKATKYKEELDDRVTTLLSFQERQGGNLLLDRFGYSQTYVAQGLYKYQQITGDDKVKKALLNHARWVRQVPPLNHEMESYLASIYPLLLGYEFSGDRKYFNEALKRAEVLKVGKLPKAPEAYDNASAYSKDLLRISNLPKSKKRFTNWELNQGLRVFGWTHAYNIPYLLYWMDKGNTP